jgi:octaheme c-type cytochrome (tetrathionate reductase family)
MRSPNYVWLAGLGVTLILIGLPLYLFTFDPPVAAADPWSNVPDRSTAGTDHTALIKGPFETGSDVTKACLSCHEDAGEQMIGTAHFTWLSEPEAIPGRDGEPQRIGKANLLNNFCIGVQSNWTSCTRCHTGYGWTSADYDFTKTENVDCLACHDQSGMYVKAAAGQPAEGVDLVYVAQSVGTPSRQNCGACHFDGGGGNGVKHGDLDESLYFPPESVDVHMGEFDFLCVDCHQTTDHQIKGRSVGVSAQNTNGVACTDCHDAATQHEDSRITEHLDTVACQTCHIPATALRDPTKVEWDWSQAGQSGRAESQHTYLKIKGAFIYENDYIPQYTWYNGTVSRYLMGDVVDPNVVTHINYPQGTIDDATALIYPFKVHLAKQPYDAINHYIIPPHTTGTDGYWTLFDWNSAMEKGAAAAGLSYSGAYGFVSTDMYWKQTHMVQPAENALTCTDCHGETGRLDWQALGYAGDPMTWGGRTK